jgi:hypothetical protein
MGFKHRLESTRFQRSSAPITDAERAVVRGFAETPTRLDSNRGAIRYAEITESGSKLMRSRSWLLLMCLSFSVNLGILKTGTNASGSIFFNLRWHLHPLASHCPESALFAQNQVSIKAAKAMSIKHGAIAPVHGIKKD